MMIYYNYKKIMGVMIITLMIYFYISFNPEWNTFLFHKTIDFLRYINLPDGGWIFLDKYLFNGAL